MPIKVQVWWKRLRRDIKNTCLQNVVEGRGCDALGSNSTVVEMMSLQPAVHFSLNICCDVFVPYPSNHVDFNFI